LPVRAARLVNALQLRCAAIIDLYRALGGGYDPATTPGDLPATPYAPRRATAQGSGSGN
jgi:hypothetical protein